MSTNSFAQPSGDATLKPCAARVAESHWDFTDLAKSYILIETNHREPQCKHIKLRVGQWKGTMPEVGTHGRAYTKITPAGAVWFFRPFAK